MDEEKRPISVHFDFTCAPGITINCEGLSDEEIQAIVDNYLISVSPSAKKEIELRRELESLKKKYCATHESEERP